MNSAAKEFKSDCRMDRRYRQLFIWCLRVWKQYWLSFNGLPDDPAVDSVVHPTLTFKSYRDAPKELLQRRMNWRFRINSAVHPTLVFELHSTAPSGCSSAPDSPTGHRCNASVHWLGHLVQQLYQSLWVTRWSDAFAGGTIGSSDDTTFHGNFSNG
jgi:hypothetical protein